MSKSSRVRCRLFLLEIFIQMFFFSFLFSYYYCSIVVCVVSGRYNWLFFALFLCSLRVVWMYRQQYYCWRVFFLLFLEHIVCVRHLWDVRQYALSWVFWFSGQFVDLLPSSTFKMFPSILQWGQPMCFSLWWDFCYIVQFRIVFSFSWDILFWFVSFISACLIVSASNIPKYL